MRMSRGLTAEERAIRTVPASRGYTIEREWDVIVAGLVANGRLRYVATGGAIYTEMGLLAHRVCPVEK